MPGLRNDIIYRRFDGNTKVLYCAHTEDLEKYLDRITYMLVETAMNISIFYTLNTSLITPDILDTMDLVVVPVTHNFLAENCTARTDIFIPAAQKGIRVLPILMEEGLEHEFNELCSNIQLLNITETDSTAINKSKRLADATRAYSGQSFGFDTDRMTKYRSEALSGFSKHIFLSYRRVDRIHANKIIEMIHELEFMRTVGVWYDEYLTLGNDYDEEINEKLLNSDLVIIISTPNLTRENNYVRDIEYPGAVSNNKRIIVIEAEKSDRNSLLNALPGITEIFDLNDRENIESLLKSIFGETGADGLSADTLFHIGQSYLLGLETEYNKEYAVDFLEKAFDAGSEKAGNNLITLYLSGPNTSVYYSDHFGVEDLIKNIDYVKAADLIEKQIALICENNEMKRDDYLKLIKYNDLLVYCWSGAYHYPQPTDVTCKMKSLELIVGMHNRFPAQEDDIIYANCKKELLQIMSRLPGNNKNAVWQYAREVWDIYRMQSAMRGYDPACDLMRLGYDLAKATDDPIWLDKAVEYEDQYYAYLKSTRDPHLPVDIYMPEYSNTEGNPYIEGRDIDWHYFYSSILLHLEARKFYNEKYPGQFDPKEKTEFENEYAFWEGWALHLYEKMKTQGKMICATCLMQTFYEAYGMYAFMLEKYDISRHCLLSALRRIPVNSLETVYDKIRNARNVIILGEKTGEALLIEEGNKTIEALAKEVNRILGLKLSLEEILKRV